MSDSPDDIDMINRPTITDELLAADQDVRAHYKLDPPAPVPPEPPPLSPVLEGLPEKDRPFPLPDCATCPAACWRILISMNAAGEPCRQIMCSCLVLHREVFDTAAQPMPLVLSCSSRIRALEELEDAPQLAADHTATPSPNNTP